MIRTITEDDAPAVRAIGEARHPPGYGPETDPWLLAQTGHRILVAEHDGAVAGFVRWWDHEGIAWFDLLASSVPCAGRELVRAVGRAAQDAGIRLARATIPDDDVYAEYFGRLGYLPVARAPLPGGEPGLVVERRLPLLTVREQRRDDAHAIAALAGEDPWVFEQGSRPGWFVASDGDAVVGVISVRDAGAGVAEIRPPVLDPAYRGRGLEVWMVERAGLYAETNGFHTGRIAAAPELEPLRRDLEDRRWFHEDTPAGPAYVRHFTGERLDSPAHDWP
ncbi:MAG: hypothetical protein M0R74_11230, partial [Dehalococcoidia bacterium]|nr:hypothetical protein [Dehalococcoidia bacterium]